MRAQDRQVVRLLHESKGVCTILLAEGDMAPTMTLSEKTRDIKNVWPTEKLQLRDLEYGTTRSAHKFSFLATSLHRVLVVMFAVVIATLYIDPRRITAGVVEWYHGDKIAEGAETCPQAPLFTPSKHAKLLKNLELVYENESFKLSAYQGLSGAVQIPTEMFDDLKPPGEDPHWEIFGKLHEFIENKFPNVHTTLTKTVVNSYALVYHWQGSDESLKPLLLTAHQDVVPVEPSTVGAWKNPPFSGAFDGEWIWGRGSCDDKSGLISSLTAIEALLNANFKPRRTVVLAYGIDEERGGIVGATAIRDYLLTTYGEDAFALLVDEGGSQELGENTIIALPSVAEKGSFNLRLEVATPGGHSSVPPPHTSIGILAALITELEANPHVPALHRNDTLYEQVQCLAAHSPDFPTSLAKLARKSQRSDKALNKLTKELERIDPLFKATAGTTQAVDIIRGGVKTNALPENAYVIVNHRIAGYRALKSRLIDVLSPVAVRFNLSIDAFGEALGDLASRKVAYGKVVLSDAFGTGLEPAPITPTTESPPYELLSGIIRNVIETSNRKAYVGRKVVVAPGILRGNTDTKHYWSLTKHIFRYSHLNNADSYNGAHTINEAIRAEGYLEMIRFFTHLILNVDETKALV
ncbi:carboxypeptidase S [Irpex rosettiformis]|uniref:Carboxypeptidase S n=1 Tax=Irpex rosettiformis TaxID=378272 RepID=A0ACB8TUS4_9APHY|nr:carboxypeptidase S [Irpex rosettiformis]